MRCRSRSLLVGILLLIGIAGLSLVATGSVAAQQVNAAASDLDGAGTQADPYVITNASELQAMEDDLDAYYELGRDINASSTAQWNNRSGFDPVGESSNEFIGSLDGNNHTIRGLTIDQPNQNRVGLFGVNKGSITDISLTNITVTGDERVGGLIGYNNGIIESASLSGSISGTDNVGGLIGFNRNSKIQDISASISINANGVAGGIVGLNRNGIIQSVSASGSVNSTYVVGGLIGYNIGNSRIQSVSASVNVNGTFRVGGLVGYNYESTVKNGLASGNVSGTDRVGGLVGQSNEGTIYDVFASGNVSGTDRVGGLIGYDDSTIENASAFGNVSGVDRVGGLVGETSPTSRIQYASAFGSVNGTVNVGGLVGLNDAIIRQTVAVGSVSGRTDVGGLVGNNTASFVDTPVTVKNSYFDEQATSQPTSAGNATGLITTQMTGKASRSNMSGLDFGTVWQSQPNEYPELITLTGDVGDDEDGENNNQSDLPGSGTPVDPYVITNVSELQAMEDDLDAYYELGRDINASSTAQWNNRSGFDPVGESGNEFIGSLDGNNHTIRGLTIDQPNQDRVGLFGVSKGSITDISLTNITVTGDERVGGLIGVNERGIIQSASVSGSITGTSDVGGLGGVNERGTIENTSASGSVNGEDDVGGLVGFNRESKIQNASISSNVNGILTVGGLAGTNNKGTIQKASVSGSIEGSNRVGGLVGYAYRGKIQNSSTYCSVNGNSEVGGIIGSNRGGTVQHTFAVGSISAGSSAGGGITGAKSDLGFSPATIKDSYFDEQATSQPTSAGNATGLTTAQMTGQAAETNMTGLGFDSVWKTQPNGYPVLRSLSSSDDTDSGSGSPANFTATINTTNNSVIVGERLEVAYTIANTGGMEATQEIEFLINGTSGPPSRNITLGSGETTSGEFGYTTDSRDTPAINITVSSATNSVTETVAVEDDSSSGGGGGQIVYEDEVFLSGSTITVNTSGASAIAVENLPTNATINKVSANGTYNSDNRSILYSNLTDEGLPANVTFRLDPDASAYAPNDTVTFSVDRTEVTLTVAAVPQELQGDVTGEQYTAVLDSDDTLSATNLADAINEWADTGEVNGVDIGAYELSELINYWADS